MDGAPLGGPVAQRHRLALLALLALAHRRSLPRDKLLAWLWPEAEATSARHLLNTSIHVIRRDLGDDVLISRRDEVELSAGPEVDVLEFQDALDRGDPEAAVQHYRAPFLDGFFLNGAGEFEQWVERERALLASRYHDALEALGNAADARGDLAAATRWWRALTHEDPYNTRAVVRLMLALERSGDRGNAIQVAKEHEAILTRELEAEPDEEFRELIRRMREEPNGLPATVFPENGTAALLDRLTLGAQATAIAAGNPAASPQRHRRALQWGIAAGLVAIAAVTVTALALVRRDPELRTGRLVVAHFENRTGNPSLDPVGFMVADWITRGVIGTGLAEMVSSDEVLRSMIGSDRDNTTEGLALAGRLARETQARHVIGGSYYSRADTIVFQAHVFDAANGRLLRAMEEVAAPSANLGTAVNTVRDRVVGAVATLLDERTRAWSDLASQPPSLEAYREYAAGMDAFLGGQVKTHAALAQRRTRAATHFRAAAALDSNFTAPLIWAVYSTTPWAEGRADDLFARLEQSRDRMAPWDRAMADHVLAHRRGDWERALAAARDAVRYAPDSEWLYKQAFVAVRLNRPHEAIAALKRADPSRGWLKNWSGYWAVLGDAHHQLGQFREELAAASHLLREHQGYSWGPPLEFRALVGLGRVAEASERAFQAIETEKRLPLMYYIRELRLHGYDAEADSVATRAVNQALAGPAGGVPSDDAAKVHLNNLLREAGRLEEAQSLLEPLVFSDSVTARLTPFLRDWSARQLGRILARRGDRARLDQVLQILTQIEKTLPEQDASFSRAAILAEWGQLHAAVGLIREMLTKRPDYSSFMHGAGDLGVLLRDYPPFQRLMRPRG